MSASAFRKWENNLCCHLSALPRLLVSTKNLQSSGFPMKNTLLAATALLLELLHTPHTTGTAGVTSIFLNRTGIFKVPHLPSCSSPKVSSELLQCPCFGDEHDLKSTPTAGLSQAIQAGFSLPRTPPHQGPAMKAFLGENFKPFKWNFREV